MDIIRLPGVEAIGTWGICCMTLFHFSSQIEIFTEKKCIYKVLSSKIDIFCVCMKYNFIGELT